MQRIFKTPGPIVVPDGTKLYELIGPRILTELGLRTNDGLSVAIGELPAGIESKVHVHPVVWHFTWVRSGTLTVKMKDPETEQPYELEVPTDHGVLTEPGTFFQLINRSEEDCEVYYFVGPAFVFEQNPEGKVLYNDAVVFEHSWKELEKYKWNPPELPSYFDQTQLRTESLYRAAGFDKLTTVQPIKWSLKNGPGSVVVPVQLHRELIAPTPTKAFTKPRSPSHVVSNTAEFERVALSWSSYVKQTLQLDIGEDFYEKTLKEIIELKCTQSPSFYSEHKLLDDLFRGCLNYLNPEDTWHLLLFGEHENLGDEKKEVALNLVRLHVLKPWLTYAITLGGGFKTVGTMENYRAYLGGLYTDPSSYRHYNPSGGA